MDDIWFKSQYDDSKMFRLAKSQVNSWNMSLVKEQ